MNNSCANFQILFCKSILYVYLIKVLVILKQKSLDVFHTSTVSFNPEMSCFAENDKFACKHPVSFDQKFGLVTISLDWKWRNGLDNFICFSEILRRCLSKFDVDAAIRSIVWHVKDYVSTTLLTWQPNWPVTATALKQPSTRYNYAPAAWLEARMTVYRNHQAESEPFPDLEPSPGTPFTNMV